MTHEQTLPHIEKENSEEEEKKGEGEGMTWEEEKEEEEEEEEGGVGRVAPPERETDRTDGTPPLHYSLRNGDKGRKSHNWEDNFTGNCGFHGNSDPTAPLIDQLGRSKCSPEQHSRAKEGVKGGGRERGGGGGGGGRGGGIEGRGIGGVEGRGRGEEVRGRGGGGGGGGGEKRSGSEGVVVDTRVFDPIDVLFGEEDVYGGSMEEEGEGGKEKEGGVGFGLCPPAALPSARSAGGRRGRGGGVGGGEEEEGRSRLPLAGVSHEKEVSGNRPGNFITIPTLTSCSVR